MSRTNLGVPFRVHINPGVADRIGRRRIVRNHERLRYRKSKFAEFAGVRFHNADPQENEQIKRGEVPERIAANPNVLAQKDLDARWTQKGDQVFYGYENHGKTVKSLS